MSTARSTTKNRPEDEHGSLADKSKSLMDQGKELAQNVAHRASETASDAASAVGRRAEQATSAVGGGLKSLGSTVRENAPEGRISSAVAQSLEQTGRYIEEEGLQGITEDLTNVIRRNPIPSLLIAAGAGFLLARAMNSRS
jgi:ABC-type transporter Mla subunit MlaD